MACYAVHLTVAWLAPWSVFYEAGLGLSRFDDGALILKSCMVCADFYMSLYNVIFTVLPPLIIGMFDQDVDRDMSRLYPGALLST